MYRIALVSREVYPFQPCAGLGAYVTATANALADDAEVTIITTDMHEEAYEELRSARSPLLPREDVRLAFARDPGTDLSEGYYDSRHLWSGRAFARLKELYPDGGPELVEFPDYLGEGAVTVQARNTFDPQLRNTQVCIRLYTTKEMTDVLNGHLPTDPVSRVACDLERYALANADWILWPGGDILESYRRFYGGALVEAELVRHPILPTPRNDQPLEPAEKLRLIYVGRLERRKGVQNLLRVVTGLASDNWELTLVGGDTPTAPLGASMRDYLSLAAADDPRISFRSRSGARRCSISSASTTWSSARLSGSAGRMWFWKPSRRTSRVLATSVGGHVELVRPGRAGWLAKDADENGLTVAFERLLDSRDEIQALVDSSGPRRHFEELTDTESVRTSYEDLAGRAAKAGRRRRSSERPLVSVVVPYFELSAYVEETSIRSSSRRILA